MYMIVFLLICLFIAFCAITCFHCSLCRMLKDMHRIKDRTTTDRSRITRLQATVADEIPQEGIIIDADEIPQDAIIIDVVE